MSAAALIGHILALEKETRVRQLSVLIHSLARLETEVVYGLTYLADAFATVAHDYPESRPLYSCAAHALRDGATAREAWNKAVLTFRRSSCLNTEDMRSLEKVGAFVGLSSAEDQRRHLQLVRSEMELRLKDARERLPQMTKLCRTLGVFGGLGTALLLL